MIRRENTIENRRGYATYMALGAAATQLTVYSSRIIAHAGSTLTYDSNGTGTPANYSGTYAAPSGVKVRSVEANSNLYFTTSEGVKVLTDVAGTAARKAGAPRSLDPSYTLSGASGFLGASYQCAYRCVIQRTDANANVLYGYPSTRLWVTNATAGTRDVALTLYIPSEAAAGDVVQVYRTAQVTPAATDAAGDEMGLVYQYTLVSADITAGYTTFTDSTTDELRGATLYISPSQEGIAQANERPPLCEDVALYKSSYLFFANTKTKQRLYLTLVGTSGLTGQTLTLAGVTYNFGATEISSGIGSPQAQVFATGSTAVNIDETARSLVRVINRYASNTAIYAYYTSGPEDLPGQITIEERGVGAAAFTAQTSNTTIAGMFYPPPPVSPATNAKSTSSNSIQKNALFFSKEAQPEHVPATNYLLVGPSNKEILRIAPLRDSLIIIKEEGVYRLVGENSSSFSVAPLDLTVFCKSADSVAVLANQVYMLSNQGVVAISDTGVQVVSHEIEPNILPLMTFSNLASYTYGTGYESERSYLLSTMTNSGDAEPTQTFVYNVFTRTWTRWTFGFTSAVVDPTTDKLFFSKSGASYVYRERKSFTDSDYADPEVAITVTAISGDTVTFTISGDTPVEGWVISQGGTDVAIESITESSGAFVATMAFTPPSSWVTGAATIYPAISMTVVWDAWSAAQPGLLKHVRQTEILTDNITGNNQTTSLVATFKTDIDGNTEDIDIDSSAFRWGSSPWGSMPWGGVGDTYAYPTYVPRNKQYCRIMNAGVKHKNAFEKISISGISYTFEVISERVGK